MHRPRIREVLPECLKGSTVSEVNFDRKQERGSNP